MAVKRGNPPSLENVRATVKNHYVCVDRPRRLIFVSVRFRATSTVEVSHLAEAGLLVEIRVIGRLIGPSDLVGIAPASAPAAIGAPRMS
jgi:hypothetical protein